MVTWNSQMKMKTGLDDGPELPKHPPHNWFAWWLGCHCLQCGVEYQPSKKRERCKGRRGRNPKSN